MPLYESSLLTQEMMKQHAKSHTCQCGGALQVAWGGSIGHNCYILRCANDLEHNDFIRPAKINNYDLPGYNMPGTMRSIEKMMMTKYGEEKTKAMVRIGGGNPIATLTQKGAAEMLAILYPEASKSPSGQAAIIKGSLICRDYGLNPAMDHIFLICYQKWNKEKTKVIGETWSVVRGIKASRLICGREKSYGYIDNTPRVMKREEQIEIFGEVDEDNLVTICKIKDKDGNVYPGYGKWPLWKHYGDKKYINEPQGTEKGNSKFNQSCIRAERQSLDKLNPGAMPADIDVVDERFMGSHRVTVSEIEQEVQQIPESSGQEAEGSGDAIEGQVENEEQNTQETEVINEKPPEKKQSEKKYKAPSEVKSFVTLYSVCKQQWPESFKTDQDVLREVGVSRQEDLSTQTPSEIYATILSIRTK